MSPTEPGATPHRDDPLGAWAAVRATALGGAAIHPVPHEAAGTAVVVWRTTGEPVVLDAFTHAVWQQLDGRSTVADLARELVGSGFPGHLEPIAVLATAVDALVAGELASSDPSPPPPLPAAHRRTIPGAAVGGARWIHEAPPTAPAPGREAGADAPPASLDDDHLLVWFENRAVAVAVTDPAVRRWIRDHTGRPPTAPVSLPSSRVDVTPTEPPGFQITVAGRPTDWAEPHHVIDRVAAAVVAAARARPPDAVVDLGPGWVAADPSGPDRQHRWCAERFLTADGHLLVPVAGAHRRWVEAGATASRDWHAEPVTALSLDHVGTDRAEILADLASASRASDRLLALQVLSLLVDRVDAGPGSPDAHRPDHTDLSPLRSSQPWTDHLLALGAVESIGRSVKLRTGAVVTDRWIVWLAPHPDLRPDQVRSALDAVGLPPTHAEPVAAAILSGRRLAFGTDGAGAEAGRKLYIEDPAPPWWATVRDLAAAPALDLPPADRASPSAPAVPAFVAWKWWPGEPRVAAYWPAPHQDLSRVLPGHDDWAAALGAFPIVPAPGAHLLLAESTGRRSLDLACPTWGAPLEPLVRRLAAVARLDHHSRDLLVEAVSDARIARVIGGLDRRGEPLAGLYLESGSEPQRLR